MSEKRASLEIIAPSVDEAVLRGLADLGLAEDAVEVEVLDAGSRGLFGLGFRQARVRLTIKSPIQTQPAEPVVTETVVEPTPALAPAPAVRQPVEIAPRQPVVTQAEALSPVAPLAEGEEPPALAKDLDSDTRYLLDVSRQTVEELLSKMKMRASVSVHMGAAEKTRDKAPVVVDIHGDDLSILIGPKAETLNALQYITGLIVSKEVGHSVTLVVDVEGFRARRSQQLRQLARRMADQAVRTGRRQVLEPMPANERRLIHIELRNNPNVTTESVGEEPRRKVTINPK